MSSSIRERILDAAEARARTGGYNNFSFRDLAEDVGIKSASVHYHFPTKADLAAMLVKRYVERAANQLGEPAELSPDEAIARVTGLFQDALNKDDKMCLCGLFGAERDALPHDVAVATGAFFRMILSYLSAAFGKDWAGENPASILSRLEGALIIARTLQDPALFEQSLTKP
jgi:TetR/AcrR family transcriptional repressor of nem operon